MPWQQQFEMFSPLFNLLFFTVQMPARITILQEKHKIHLEKKQRDRYIEEQSTKENLNFVKWKLIEEWKTFAQMMFKG